MRHGVVGGSMTLLPDIYLCKTAGIEIVPLRCWKVSHRAIRVRGMAHAVPFTVWTNLKKEVNQYHSSQFIQISKGCGNRYGNIWQGSQIFIQCHYPIVLQFLKPGAWAAMF